MLALCVITPTAVFANTNWFSFSPSAPVTAGSAVDASSLLVDYPGQDVSTVIDGRGHLHAAGDGHFYFTGTGKRAKFFGPNFMVNTIFPPTPDAPQQPGEYAGIVPPDAADQLAVRLARMGVNIVRLHFIDGGYARPVSIWDPAYPNSTRHFDPLQVSRLDYLIFSLKRHGIYCDINLHAGRVFRSEDGVKDYDKFPDLAFNKPATQFDPVMIQLQQEYASELLSHVNPYTNVRLADDPAVAFVEISNEDSMLYSFANDQLAAFTNISACFQGMSCGLPASYSADLDRLWNIWLHNKYGSDEALRAAWDPNSRSFDEFRSDLIFAAGGPLGWTLRCFDGARGLVTSPTGTSARIDVYNTPGTINSVQLDTSGLSLQNGQLYDLSLYLKGTAGTRVRVDLIQDQYPYTFYQVAGAFDTQSIWQTVSTTFQANVTSTGHVQMNLNVGAAVGQVWIGQVWLRRHAANGLLPGESLSLQSVGRQTTAHLSSFTRARNQDLHQFYYQTEQSFFDGMNSYLRNTVGVKSMMTGTAVFGLPLNADLASHQDFVDEHAYSDYPSLTDTADNWSSWTIQNKPFSADPSFFLFTWASLAVKGKPFTVTESDEPFPNDYAVEWLPWLTTFANFQDWDALMPKLYGNWPDNYFADTPPGWPGNHFFALGGNPIASAQYPVASRVFLASQNTSAAGQIDLQANRTDLLQNDPKPVTGQFFGANGYATWQALVHSIRTSYGDVPSSRTAYAGDPPPVLTSDHGELIYDASDKGKPIYQVNSPYLQSVTGFVAGKTVNMPNLSVTVSPSTAPFASITLQPVDGQPLLASKRLLLSVLTRYENTGVSWNATRTSLGNQWGSAPSLVEPITAAYTLRLRPDSHFSVFALDAQGNRTRQAGDGTGNLQLTLDTGADQTVWYEVVANQAAAALPVADQFYYLVAKHSGRCLEVQGGPSATQDGVPLQQWMCWGGDNQKWQFISAPQGGYQIMSKSSGKAVDVVGGPGSLSNGVPVQQWSFWGGTNQIWKLVGNGDSYQFVSGSSGLCLDVAGGPIAVENNVGVQQWSCWGGSNQLWQLIRAN
jgi:hypothetical protein